MDNEDQTPRFASLRAFFGGARRHSRLVIAAIALASVGYVGGQAWRFSRQGMREDPRFLVTAASIQTPTPPPWIRTDIRLEALRDAGLHGQLSILDPPEQLQQKLADAFAFHPWVDTVGAITKRPPNRVTIDLTYRRPAVAVEMARDLAGSAGRLWPVDTRSVRLPGGDLSEAELRHLPRVLGVTSTTLTGEVWRDARVQGAVALAGAFGDQWPSLQLVDIVPRKSPEIFGDLRYAVFDLVTRGGTRIVWGAAPNASPPGEATFATKLSRLNDYISKNGPLSSASIETPEVLDVRTGIRDTPRTAKTKEPRTAKAEEESDPGKRPVVK